MTGRGALAARNNGGHRSRGRIREGRPGQGNGGQETRGAGTAPRAPGAGNPASPSPGGELHPLAPLPPGDSTHLASPQPRVHSPRRPLPASPRFRAPCNPPHLHATPRPLSSGEPPPLRTSPAPSPRGAPAADSGQSTRRTGSGPLAAQQPLPRGRGAGPPGLSPAGTGAVTRARDPRPRPPIRGGGRTEPGRPEIVRDRPSLLYAWGN